ncbi:MAG: hypothetical protein KA224_03090 [Steroidobacteraceae bacterium]|nr:hypothetical protein [Steroidobacteraceae bacterium]
MSEKPEEDFDEEAEELAGGDEGLDLDHLMRDLDTGKKRGKHAPVGEPAWRRLERLREDRRTTQLLSDFDDYDVGDDEPGRARPRKPARGKHRD